MSSHILQCLSIFLSLSLIRTSDGSQAAGTETLVGIVGKDFIVLGADSSVSQSISLTASNLDKIASLSDPFPYYDDDDDDKKENPSRQQAIVAAAAGDAADSDRLVGFLQAHSTIQEYQSGVGCDVDYVYLPSSTTKSKQLTAVTRSSPSNIGLDVEAVANLARTQIASSLRSRTPLKVCLLVAGMMPVTTSIGGDGGADGEDNNKYRGADDASFFVSRKVQEQVQRASLSKYSSPASDVPKEVNQEDVVTGSVDLEGRITKTGLEPRLYWLDEYGSMQKIKYGSHGYGSNFCLSILDQGYRPNMTQEEAIKLLRDCFQQLRTRYIINSPKPPCIKCIDSHGIRLIP